MNCLNITYTVNYVHINCLSLIQPLMHLKMSPTFAAKRVVEYNVTCFVEYEH